MKIFYAIILFLSLLFYTKGENVEEYLKQNRESIRNGRAINNFPRGTILMISSTEMDYWFNILGAGLGEYQGWYICDGRNGTPDLRGRFVVGRDTFNSDSDYSSNGKTGGVEKYSLTEEHLPPHDHEFGGQTKGNGDHSHIYDDITYADCYGSGVIDTGTRFRGISSGSPNSLACHMTRTSERSGFHSHDFSGKTNVGKGKSKVVDNRPPFSVVAFIIYRGI